MTDETPTPSTPPRPQHPKMRGDHWAVNDDAPDVLVLNARKGYFVLPYNEPQPPSDEEREPYRVHRLKLAPGLNFVHGDIWAKLVEHNAEVRLRIRSGVLRPIGTAKDWHKQGLDDRIGQVEASGDLKTLETLAKGHKPKDDDELTEALEDALTELRERDKDREEQRREQRRARRRQRVGYQ